MFKTTLALCSLATTAAIPLVTFDGASGTTFKFSELNDPVMGGKSSGTWHVDTAGKFGVMDGEVNDVPSLKAPGFIKSAADGTFADVSSDLLGSLVLSVRSSTPEYQGFRVSFAAGTLSPSYSCAGGGSIPLSRGCFKSHFVVPAGDSFTDIKIPFTQFSDLWSPSTGKQTKTCATDSGACPTSEALAKILRIEVWAEGADGKAHLEIQSISTSHTPKTLELSQVAQKKTTRPPAQFDACKTAVQDNLKFGVSGRTESTVPVTVSPGESMAESVCCDRRAEFFAEPQFLFEAPDINLFAKLENGTTVFYDSVCGVPVFQTPVNRTLADFKADTTEHGWPSFREAEVFHENVRTNKTSTFVTSSCGTHLGSYLPDAKGHRWCIDLSCISGSKGF